MASGVFRRRTRGDGRRLSDGQRISDPDASHARWVDRSALLLAAGFGIAVATIPSHSSFVEYLDSVAQHPAGTFGSFFSTAERIRIALLAESYSWLFFRLGRFRGDVYVGCFHTWCLVPQLPASATTASVTTFSRTVCQKTGGAVQAFVLLCCAVHLLWYVFPRTMQHMTACSLRALQKGRLFVLLTANISHYSLLHLIHNMLQIMHLGPTIQAVLGCEDLLCLMVLSALGSSLASVLWNGVLGERPHVGSVGASGVAMSLVAANAALFPHVPVFMYGLELTPAQLVCVYLLLDTISQRGELGSRVDVSAHVGGAAAGWWLAKRWSSTHYLLRFLW